VDLVLSPEALPGVGGFTVRRRLASHAVRADGTQILLADLIGRALTAVAGIAKPEAFFGMLREQGLQLARTLPLPDHHDFGKDPADGGPGDLLCTEKDAVKLWRLRPDAWAVPLALEIDAEFWRALDGLVDAKLSSAHGPQTA
jgi:tetraacyldisaccharide 4'-kinase